jgi:hypothetical protein
MSVSLFDLFAYGVGRPRHPIYRRELAGWSYLGFWRQLRKGCLPLVAVIVVLMACFCGGLTLLSVDDLEQWPLVAAAILVGVFFAQAVIHGLMGLLAVALASTTISAEVEAQTFHLLRATPMPVEQIVLAKFGATFRQVRLPVAAIIVLRILLIVGTVAAIIAALVLIPDANPSAPPSLPPGAEPTIEALPGSALAAVVAGVVAFVVLSVLWLAYFLARPVLNAMLFVAIGLFGSTLGKTRSGGLIAAFGIRAALWAVSYILSQVVSTGTSLLLSPLFVYGSPLLRWLEALVDRQPALAILAGTAVVAAWFLIAVGLQLGVTLLAVKASARRAARLPFGIG